MRSKAEATPSPRCRWRHCGFKELAPSQAIGLPYVFEHIWDMQSTMLQPVGGMDRIAHAIYEQVKPACG